MNNTDVWVTVINCVFVGLFTLGGYAAGRFSNRNK